MENANYQPSMRRVKGAIQTRRDALIIDLDTEMIKNNHTYR